MNNKKIKVLVVDDSSVARELLTFIIDSDPQLKVIGYANDGEAALKFLEHETPDVITMDIFMPKLDGFETTRRIMETHPIPIIIISAGYDSSQVEKSFRAINAGALAILPKPAGPGDPLYSIVAQEIVETIKVAHGVKLIKRRPQFASPPVYNPERSADGYIETNIVSGCSIKAIAIGASLGGPPALAAILSELSPSFPVPIFIVQHIAVGFAQGFADWLDTMTNLNVVLAKNHEQAKPGWVYVAPETHHMEVTADNAIAYIEHNKEHLFPSVAHLFRSMAYAHGPRGVGVILTGMGKDGAAELLLMKKQGAFTIAQDEESCVMFGMPKEAIAIGAATRVVPIQKIASLLKQLTDKEILE